MDVTEEYNQDEELEIAEIMRNKSEIIADERVLVMMRLKRKGKLRLTMLAVNMLLSFLKSRKRNYRN